MITMTTALSIQLCTLNDNITGIILWCLWNYFRSCHNIYSQIWYSKSGPFACKLCTIFFPTVRQNIFNWCRENEVTQKAIGGIYTLLVTSCGLILTYNRDQGIYFLHNKYITSCFITMGKRMENNRNIPAQCGNEFGIHH